MPISRFWGYTEFMIEAQESKTDKKRKTLESINWDQEVAAIKAKG